MPVSPQQKKFTADAKAAMHMRDLSIRKLAAEFGVHPNSVWMAINHCTCPSVLERVCERLNITPPVYEQVA